MKNEHALSHGSVASKYIVYPIVTKKVKKLSLFF